MEDEDGVEVAELPSSMSGHRACMRCGLVKCFNQFYESGCENCPFLEFEGRQDRVERCTTSDFDGVFSMVNPDDSWVARYEGVSTFLPGVYALKMYGDLPDEVEQMLADNDVASRALKPEDA